MLLKGNMYGEDISKTKNLQTEEDQEKEVQACLLSLYEEPTFQETEETPNLLNLI